VVFQHEEVFKKKKLRKKEGIKLIPCKLENKRGEEKRYRDNN